MPVPASRNAPSGGPGVRCAFCAIAAGGQPGHVVADEPEMLAFLDARPVFAGHTLVVPRPHVPTLAELSPAAAGALFAMAQRLAAAVRLGLGADGAFLALNDEVSQSVAHVHVHVVPRRRGDGLRGFFWPRQRYPSEEEAAQVAACIRDALASAPQHR